MSKNKYIALIPAYNPDDKLLKLVKELIKHRYEIVVVDDGSNDNSQLIFNSLEQLCNVIHHTQNKGKGCAIKTGLQFIKDNYQKNFIVVTMDSDGQHRIEDADKICAYSEEHPSLLVLGGRKFDGKVPLRSRIGNSITRNIFFLITKNKIYDTQTGLRSFSDKLIDKMLSIAGNRYEYEINVLLECSKNKIPIHELRIETIYIDNNSSSHFNPLKDSIKIYKAMFKYLFH